MAWTKRPRQAAFMCASLIAMMALSCRSSDAQTVNYTYDSLGRLVTSSSASGCTTYTYDAAGNRTQYTATNGIPTAVNLKQSTYLNTAATFDPRLSNPSCQALTVTAVGPASNGTTVLLSGGVGIKYTPSLTSPGSDSFTYTLTNASGSATGNVMMSVNAAPLPPVATNGLMSQIFDITPPATSVVPIIMLTIDTISSDPYGYPLTVAAVTQGVHGTVSLNSANTIITYTYNNPVSSNKEIGDHFNYTVTDGYGLSASATINVSISVTNHH